MAPRKTGSAGALRNVAFGQLEQLRGVGALERVNQAILCILERQIKLNRPGHGWRGGAEHDREIRKPRRSGAAKRYRTLDRVAQLADVAGPGIAHKSI